MNVELYRGSFGSDFLGRRLVGMRTAWFRVKSIFMVDPSSHSEDLHQSIHSPKLGEKNKEPCLKTRKSNISEQIPMFLDVPCAPRSQGE